MLENFRANVLNRGLALIAVFNNRAQAIISFFISSPINSKGWTTAYFEQFKSLGMKHIRLAR